MPTTDLLDAVPMKAHDSRTVFAYDEAADECVLVWPRESRVAAFDLKSNTWTEITPDGPGIPKAQYGSGKGYYDPTHNYVSGLDPNYLFDKDSSLSRLYERISLGTQDDPGPLIRDRFGARYVFSDNNHHDFFEKAGGSGWFDIVYEDSECVIMYIRDERIGPVEETLGPSPPGSP